MNHFVKLAIVMGGVLFFSIPVTAQTYKALVHGRIVDDAGNPVARARVALESLPENNIDGFSYNEMAITDKDGKFIVENTSTKAHRERKLFVSGPFPENAIRLVDLPPSVRFRRLKPDFHVMSVVLTKDIVVDLGDVKIKVGIGLVEITLVDSKGDPYFKTDESWRANFYVLRNEKNEVYMARGISGFDTESRIDIEKGMIRFAIPEGTWRVEFVSDLADLTSVLARTDILNLMPVGEPIKIRLVIDDRK